MRSPECRHCSRRSGGIWHIVLVSTLFLAGIYGVFVYALDKGYSLELAQTMALNTLVVLKIFHLFFIRNIHGTSLTWTAVRGTRVVWERTPFHITRNELAVADERRAEWCLFRMWNFSREPRAFELYPPLDAHVSLTPTSFQASFH